MARGRAISYHILFWGGVYLSWVLLFRSYSVSLTRTMTIEFCYLLFITADYYAINNLAVPRLLHRKRYGLFVAGVLLVITISAGARAALASVISARFFPPPGGIDYGGLYLRSFINISLWVLAVTIGRMLIDRMKTQQQLETLERDRVRSELDYLKAQINPHALFNSLNTIYGHIDKHNQVARNILLQFSELLRYQLYDCTADKVGLQKEIGYIQNYVAFQRLRKDERLIVHFKVGEIGERLSIAPLMLVVLIENAFKFVSSFPDRPNKICIEIFTSGSLLHAHFLNTCEPQIADGGSCSGIGIVNLRRRLELLYNRKYEMKAHSDYDCYETNLTIDLS
ncbi:MAG TPA: sensor histidine kinase [Puia sp.]|nr:sensor histidine kinase [Puia sp.]